MEPQLGKPQAIALTAPQQRRRYQNGGEILRDDAGHRHTRHVHIADDDEEQVQHHIDNAGDGEVVQRAAGITHRGEHGVAKVIDRQRGHTQTVDAQVQHSAVHQLRFGVQRSEDTARKAAADSQQHQSRRRAGQCRRVDGIREVLLIVSSEVVRHQYVDAAGQSDEEAGKQGHENGGGAHRSQRCGAREPADHRHVRHIE